MFMSSALSASQLKTYLESYCYKCHDEDVQKGDVRLDNLDISKLKLLTRVYDAVAHDDMPPKKQRKQPKLSHSKTFLKSLGTLLTKIEKGRNEVVMRRLNREEFKNSVNDLLSININHTYMLPEDASSHGFDNIGTKLSLSTELMESYLKYADKAVDEAIYKDKKPKTFDKSFNPKDFSDIKKSPGQHKILPNGAVYFHEGKQTTLYQFRAPFRGKYKISIKHKPYQNSKNLPVKMRLYAGNFSLPGQWWLEGYFDSSKEGTETVREIFLRKSETIRFGPYNTGFYLKDAQTTKRHGLEIQKVSVKGPLLDSWPVKSYASLFGSKTLKECTDSDARQMLIKLLPKAFRRPVQNEEIERYFALYKGVKDKNGSFELGVKAAIKGILCSPDFLYLIESKSDTLSSYETVARLSYFLWSTMPDKELTDLAKSTQALSKDQLLHQAKRMLKDPKSQSFIDNFTGQWLKLREIDSTVPDKKLYPEYDEYLRNSILEETKIFFKEILQKDLSVMNFIDSDWLIINDRLAEHYLIDGIKGSNFRKISIPKDSPRGGVLTQSSIMKVTANGTDTSPILRGVWMLENILGVHLPPAPTNVPAVEPDIRGAVTIREQMDKHVEIKSCQGCHSKIDPVGFAFENFDPVGYWRDYYRTIGGEGKRVHKDKYNRRVLYRVGPNVDSSEKFADGASFSGVKEFKAIIYKKYQEKIIYGLTQKLATYATGRPMGFSDRTDLKKITASVKSKDNGLKSIILSIIQSNIFLKP